MQTKGTEFILFLTKLMVKFLTIKWLNIIVKTEINASHFNTEVISQIISCYWNLAILPIKDFMMQNEKKNRFLVMTWVN